MPEPGDDAHDPMGRLDDRLASFEARHRSPRAPSVSSGGAADGYRLVSLMMGGVFGGVALGWVVDHFAHTRPFGIVAGLLIGAGASVFSTIRAASRMSAGATKTTMVAPAAVDDDDEDEA